MGSDVQLANNGREAVMAVTEDHDAFDLIFMDYQMPELDGIEATREIREFEDRSDFSPLPIIALTAETDDMFKDRCLEAGIQSVLCKPFSRENIIQILKQYH